MIVASRVSVADCNDVFKEYMRPWIRPDFEVPEQPVFSQRPDLLVDRVSFKLQVEPGDLT